MRALFRSWLLWLASISVALAQADGEIVDDPSTYWDERIMPIIEPIIERSNTWAPAENIDWEGVKLAPEEALPRKQTLDIKPERIRGLLEKLDLNRPGLERVRELFQSGKLDDAGYALVEYYRAKPWPKVLKDAKPPTHLDYALVELAMLDIFVQGQVFGRQPRKKNGLLNWEHGGPRNDPEWAWWINRMGYLRSAVRLWESTGDPRYPAFASEQLNDWVLANPYPGVRTYSAPWRPLEVARRIDSSWLDVLIRMRHSPDLRPEARLRLLSSIPDHADALLNHPSFSGNHLLTEKVMLAELAVAFPEFKDAQTWLSDSVKTVVSLLDEQAYPDGSYEELTNHYQWVALGSFQRFLELIEMGGASELVARARPTIENLWNYFAYVMRPNGYGPLNNDSDLINNREVLQNALDWFDRPDWDYLASAGQRGEKPTGSPTRFFPWAGHAIMRSGWEEDAQWAFFDLGPYGADHQHNDRLHLSIAFGGKDFLVDSGRYDYTPGPARDYHTGPLGHNTIMLDGRAPLPGPNKVGSPMNVQAIITPEHQSFGASVYFPADTLHSKASKQAHRQVEFFPELGWVITDEIIAYGPTKVEARWLFHPERNVELIDHSAVTTDEEGENIRIVLDSDLHWQTHLYLGQTLPFQAGWYSDSFTTRQQASQAVFTTYINGPVTMQWLIAPTSIDLEELKHAKERPPNTRH